jgi:hypothetical protein
MKVIKMPEITIPDKAADTSFCRCKSRADSHLLTVDWYSLRPYRACKVKANPYSDGLAQSADA